MKIQKLSVSGLAGLLLLLLITRAEAAPGYYPGSYYAAHVIRDGGELVSNEESEKGYRWEDFTVLRTKGNRIPAKVGHGLEVFADIYGMPVGEPVTLRVVRPVRTATGGMVTRSFTRSQMLYETDSYEVQVFNYTYFLDEPDELVTGKWIIEVTYQDTLILRQTFEVYPDPS